MTMYGQCFSVNMTVTKCTPSLEKVWWTIKGQVDPASTVEVVYTTAAGYLLIFFTVIGLALNSLALVYFHRRSNVFNNIVKVKAVLDMIICLSSLSPSLSLLNHRQPMLFHSRLFCQLWGGFWRFAARMSAHLVAISSITTTYTIWYPRRVVATRLVTRVICADIAILALVELAVPAYGKRHFYLEAWAACVPDFSESDITARTLRSVVLTKLPVFLDLAPLPLTAASYAFSCFKLLCQGKSKQPSRWVLD